MLITNLKSAINHTWICEQSMYFSIARREITSLQRCLWTFKTLWWRCRPEDTQCWQINILQSIQYLFNSFLRNGWVEHDSKKFSFRKASNHIGFSTLLCVTSWSYKLCWKLQKIENKCSYSKNQFLIMSHTQINTIYTQTKVDTFIHYFYFFLQLI
jgi:hypothetical protein